MPHTDRFLFNYIDKNNLFNLTRRMMSFLDVRSYSYHSQKEISSLVHNNGFSIAENKKLGTGFILELKKN